MTPQAWLNGRRLPDSDAVLPATNRGLHYGDGVFETMRCERGEITLLDAHLARALEGCDRLGIVAPSRALLIDELQRAVPSTARGILKLLLIRGGASRGYRPEREAGAMRLILSYPYGESATTLRVQWCRTRWSRNVLLAGLKHLNRLEQVLAQQELGADVDEGLMLDEQGAVISATSGNVFVVREGVLFTPDLQASGVRGVMRQHVITTARKADIAVEERRLSPGDVEAADEVFITNAVRRIRPVIQLQDRTWSAGPITTLLQRSIGQ